MSCNKIDRRYSERLLSVIDMLSSWRQIKGDEPGRITYFKAISIHGTRSGGWGPQIPGREFFNKLCSATCYIWAASWSIRKTKYTSFKKNVLSSIILTTKVHRHSNGVSKGLLTHFAFSQIWKLLESIGYEMPVHPPQTHTHTHTLTHHTQMNACMLKGITKFW